MGKKQMVSQHTVEQLRFNTILQNIGHYCIAEDSITSLYVIYPYTNKKDVLNVHKKVSLMFEEMKKKSLAQTSFVSSLHFLSNAKQHQKAQWFFTADELSILRRGIENMYKCFMYNKNFSKNDVFFTHAQFPHNVYTHLCRYFDSQGKLQRDKISKLLTLNKKRQRIYTERQKIANTFLQENAHICASQKPAIRDNRLVLVLQSSYKTQVEGIIHGSSASDKSAYVEIPKLYELNNEAQNFDLEEERILREIFLEIAQCVKDEYEVFLLCYKDFLEFDRIHAQCCYANKYEHVLVPYDIVSNTKHVSEETQKYYVYLENVCHPLVKDCSPLNIKMSNTESQLVLVGPNAGGKTVALLTLGLLSLMNQSGIAIPIKKNKNTQTQPSYVLPLFNTLCLVMGDHQSLEEGYSTFFSHILNIKDALKQIEQNVSDNEHSLLLFDELCSGTDDQEGGALACAILDYLAHKNDTLKTKICVVLSTHLGLVKKYAIENSHIQIASLHFTKPNIYKIMYKVVASSEARKIAQQLGLDNFILERQKQMLCDAGNNYNEALKVLQKHVLDAQKIQEELLQNRQEYESKAKRLRVLESQLKEKEVNLIKKNIAEGHSLLATLRSSIEKVTELVSMLKKQQQTTTQNSTTEDLDLQIANFRKDVKTISQDLENLHKNAEQREQKQDTLNSNVTFEVGDEVLVKSYGGQKNVAGKIISVSKGLVKKYKVQAGIISIHVEQENLIKMESSTSTSDSVVIRADLGAEELSSVFMVDVRGCRAEEAVQIVNRNIDKAIISNISMFSVLHGKGEGVLMKAISDVLKNTNAVVRYKYAHESDGGAGKTYVYLS